MSCLLVGCLTGTLLDLGDAASPDISNIGSPVGDLGVSGSKRSAA